MVTRQACPVRTRHWHLLFLLAAGLLLGGAAQPACGQDPWTRGTRPYELDWAGRFTDAHVPLVDFENLEGWSLEANGGAAQMSRSQEQMLWGRYTCKLAYRGRSAGASFVLRPPKPIAIPSPFTAINLWVWNDVWMWKEDRGKPQARLSLLLETAGGQSLKVDFPRDLDWPGWYLLHLRLAAEQRKAFAQGGFLRGIRLSNCLLEAPKSIFLDNLSFYQEDTATPAYDILPRPGVDLAPGQDLGVHTGAARLPFPTREETLLPENITKHYTAELLRDGTNYLFRYQGEDGVLEYRYSPQRGDLGDVTAQWRDGASGTIRPMEGGGVQLKLNDNVQGLLTDRFGTFKAKEPLTAEPEKKELLECSLSGQSLVSRWRLSRQGQSAEVQYVFRLWQKSLVIDVHCPGGAAGGVSLGKVSPATKPRLIRVPYWVGRPTVLLMESSPTPLFLTSFVDHYRTGASQLYFKNRIDEDGVFCGGGTRYLPKTNGRRNDCHERLFLTLSPRFEETLPTIPNPVSRWRSEAAKYLVCYYAVDDRAADEAHWKKIARYGMNQVLLLDWETCWRDGAESFTFRTSAAPGKGGDESLKAFSRNIQQLGFRYALYNNYVDFAPVNALWDENMVSLLPYGGWQQSWFRCYVPKSSRIVKLSRTITTMMQDKFNPNAGGPDVHTAVNPWALVDYDARVPGAGTMMSQYYAYGQLLLEQQNIWNGPVYGEGGNSYYYSGLITGCGAIDHDYDFAGSPWLVDFYLRKMQPLGCDWAIPSNHGTNAADCDRFLARTIAFGLPGGFLGGWRREFDPLMIKGYYMLQQLQSSYCKALIKDIRYADQKGALLDVSAALVTGACNRSQVRLEYDNGLLVWVNGSNKENWQASGVTLPPSGYYARTSDGSLEVFSGLNQGARADYVHSPAYDYVDGREHWMETPWAASDGQLIILKNQEGGCELIPLGTQRFAIALGKKPETTMALDVEGKPIGPATGDLRGGYYRIRPVPGAVSYRLSFQTKPAAQAPRTSRSIAPPTESHTTTTSTFN